MPFFMQAGNIKGSSKEKGYENWIEVMNGPTDSSNIGVNQSVQNNNRIVGKVMQSEYSINANFDKAMAEIISTFTAGEPVGSTGTVVLVQTHQSNNDDAPHAWSVHELTNTYVSGFSISLDSWGNTMATVTLNFNMLMWEYRIQASDGTQKGVVKGGWDFVLNQPLAGPTAMPA